MWLIITLLIFIICAGVGYRKGLVEITTGLVAGIAVMLLVAIVSPILSQIIIDYTTVDEQISQGFVEYILSNTDVTYEIGGETVVYDEVQAVLDINLPSSLRDKILENNNVSMYTELGVNNFYEYVGSYIARWIIRLTTYIIVLIAAMLFMKMFVFSLLMISRVPLINGVNRAGGLVIGIFVAIIAMWIFYIVADLLHQMQWSIDFIGETTNYKFFEILYRENPIMGILSR